MKCFEFAQVDTFTAAPLYGNPAAVVFAADELATVQMQRIASEMNLSETAFVSQSKAAGIKLRFFTPRCEVDLCGHATLGSIHALLEAGRLAMGADGGCPVETNSGILRVEARRGAEGSVLLFMEQSAPEFRAAVTTKKEIAEILGVDAGDVVMDGRSCPMSYTGLWHLLVQLRSLSAIRSVRVNHELLLELNRKCGAATTHVFSFETEEPSVRIHARSFAPAVGVPEDPATGTANGALGAYLVKMGLVRARGGKAAFSVEQGLEIGRKSRVFVEVDSTSSKVAAVRVGGRCVTVMKGLLRISPTAGL